MITKFGSQIGQQHYIMAKWSNWIYDYTGGEFRGIMKNTDDGISMWVSHLYFPNDYILFMELERKVDVYPCWLTLNISSDKKCKLVMSPEDLESYLEEFIKDPVIDQTFARLLVINNNKRRRLCMGYNTMSMRDNPNNY